MIKEIVLDINKIFPTDHPRLSSAVDLGRAKKLEDIDWEGVVLDDVGDGNFYVQRGHHRVARALELAPGRRVSLEVIIADSQTRLNIYAARERFKQNNELLSYDDYIRRTRWFRREI